MLFLFDIDGTLLKGATDAHSQALREALREVHGIDAERARLLMSPAGRTDGEIARALLLGAGVSAERIDDGADAVREACGRIYAQLGVGDLSGTVLPGIPALLSWLSERDDARLALVTGNFETIARLKLKAAGIGTFFPAGQGGFGSDSEDRLSLPPIARHRAGRVGTPVPRSETVVIGDTPRDIACARADELRCIAVSTGPFAADRLSDADVVAQSPEELRAAIEALLG